MSVSNKKPLLIALLVIVLLLLAGYLWNVQSSSEPNEIAANQSKEDGLGTPSTIATQWQWEAANTDSASTQSLEKPLPYTPESVFNALQAVELDEDGNVILNHDALISLDEALERIHDQLDRESLLALQNLIRESLPGIAGEQTAKLVADYYQFLEAKAEFSRLNEDIDEDREQTVDTLEDDESLYGELQALREVHLGTDTTEKLFRVTDANAKYMFESLKLGVNQDLSVQEIEAKRQQIQAEHTEQSVNIANWPSRYRAFINSKQNILASSLSLEEKQDQVNQLLLQMFNTQELKRIDYLGLGNI
ncbi:hypothetical protein OAP14_08275 [Aliiglaciecola sp.]|nr:hypothetical protein [Aliiglaciecola sp.]